MLKKYALLALPFGLAGVLVHPVPAAADVVCSELTGSCTISAEEEGSAGETPNRSPQEEESSDGETEAVPTCEERTEDNPGEACGAATISRGGDEATPEEVAQQVIEELPLSAPEAGLAPKPSGMGLVGLPVWMWIPDDDWTSVSETASAGSVSVTATAEPTSVAWRMGDGATVACDGPGTPYTTDAETTSSPDCGHTYAHTSADQPDQRYRITATVHWDIGWEGGGSSGSDELTRTSSTSLTVGEAQSLVQ